MQLCVDILKGGEKTVVPLAVSVSLNVKLLENHQFFCFVF